MAITPPYIPDYADRVISIENNGVWTRGNTYTVVWRYYKWEMDAGGDDENFYHFDLAPVWGLPGEPSSHSEGLLFSSRTTANAYVAIDQTTPANLSDFYTDYSTLVYKTGDILALSSQSAVINEMGSDSTGSIRDFTWTIKFSIPSDFSQDKVYLLYWGDIQRFTDGDNFNVFTELIRDYHEIKIVNAGEDPPSSFPDNRPDDYDSDTDWNPTPDDGGLGEWTTDPGIIAAGGGRHRKQIVAINNKGNVYFGDI